MWLTDQPHRWAIGPAVYMMLVGAGLLISAPHTDTMILLGWVLPPILLALVVWMSFSRARICGAELVYGLCIRCLGFWRSHLWALFMEPSSIEDESDAAVASQAILDAVESVRIGTSLADS